MPPSFSDEPWDAAAVSSGMDAEEYCKLCLVDANEPGASKVKGLCKLPIRSTPGGPVNKAALRNAAARLSQMTGVSDAEMRKAASRMVGLMKSAGMDVGEHVMRMAGRE